LQSLISLCGFKLLQRQREQYELDNQRQHDDRETEITKEAIKKYQRVENGLHKNVLKENTYPTKKSTHGTFLPSLISVSPLLGDRIIEVAFIEWMAAPNALDC
jgi:hypothetical protein